MSIQAHVRAENRKRAFRAASNAVNDGFERRSRRGYSQQGQISGT
jgi:hypothetical protein